jgi:hypothetical protein
MTINFFFRTAPIFSFLSIAIFPILILHSRDFHPSGIKGACVDESGDNSLKLDDLSSIAYTISIVLFTHFYNTVRDVMSVIKGFCRRGW